MTRRTRDELNVEMQHIEWLLREINQWDRYAVAPSLRRQLTEQYQVTAQVLRDALAEVEANPVVHSSPQHESPVGEGAPKTDAPPEVTVAPQVAIAPPTEPGVVAPVPTETPQFASAQEPAAQEPAAQEPAAQEPVAQEPTSETEPEGSAPEPVFAAKQPSSDDRVVAAASTWNRIWKPFLTESIGWFIGGFLILAGTLYLVRDAWGGMSDVSHALTVFGLAGGWTLAFVTWARFLLRREHTRAAGAVLERIAAIIAPLATVAVGPVQSQSVLFWPIVLGWSAVAGWLAHAATRRVDARAALPIGGAFVLSTFALGAAPFLAPLGPSAVWLNLLPILLCGWVWQAGPRETANGTRFVFSAMLYATALFVIRMHVMLRAAGAEPNVGTYAPFVAALAASALWLRTPTGRAADFWSVSVVSAQALLLLPAALAPAPSFIVGALLSTFTAVVLTRERVSPASARWVVPAYVFGYAAFQRIDQLVPGVVTELFNALKLKLGYESAPLPPSYGSVYAAMFVVAVGLVAARRFVREEGQRRLEADLLLWCTAVATVLFGGLAVASLGTDARPALLATPALTLLGLGLGAWLNRKELVFSGVLLAMATAASYAWWLQSPWPVGAVALALAAAASFASNSTATEPGAPTAVQKMLSGGAVLLVAITCLGAWSPPVTFGQPLALSLATVAALLSARLFASRPGWAMAWLVPFLLVVRLSQFVAPEYGALVLALVALAGAYASRRESWLETVWVPSSLAAMVAVLWGLNPEAAHPGGAFVVLRGLEVPIAAVAMWLASTIERRKKKGLPVQISAVASAALCLWPKNDLVVFDWVTPGISVALAVALVAACAVRAVRSGREWQNVLFVSLVALVSLVDLANAASLASSELALAWPVGAVFFLATPVLLGSVTVPVGALLWLAAAWPNPWVVLALTVALSAVSLFEEFDLTWHFALNRKSVAWAASLSALGCAVALAGFGKPPSVAWALVFGVVPLVWVRATRSGVLSGAAVALAFVLGQRLGDAHVFLPVVAAAGLSRLTELQAVRAWLGRERPGFGTPFLVVVALVALASSAEAYLQSRGWPLPLAWALGLLLMRDEALAVRVGLAAVVLLGVPETWPFASFGLVALAFGLHHGERRVATALGAASAKYAAVSAVVAAVVLSGLGLYLEPASHVVDPHVTFAVALASAAVLLDWPVLLSVVVVSLGVNANERAWFNGQWLTPLAPYAALIAAALALVLRWPVLSKRIERAWAALGRKVERPLASPMWAGAFMLALLSLPVSAPSVWWLAVAALLVLSPENAEAALGLVLGAVMVGLVMPLETAGLIFATAGVVLTWVPVWLESRLPVMRMWHHVGWLLSLAALGCCWHLASPALAVVWALMALSMWGVAARRASREPLAWVATWAAVHAVLAHAGVALSTGAPRELIWPWFAAGSMAVAAYPLLRPHTPARRRFSHVVAAFSVLELFVGVCTIAPPHVRETLVGVLTMLVGLVLLGRQALSRDDARATGLAQFTVVLAVLTVHHLGLGAPFGLTELWSGIVFGLVLSETAARTQGQVAATLRLGAYVWPLAGVAGLFTDSFDPRFVAVALLAVSAHFALMARSTQARGAAAVASALAFNAAVYFGYQATGWHSPQYLALPAGVSMLMLIWVFRESMEPVTAARLRAVAMTIVYSAASWEPLTFSATWALWLCVLVCVVGVALGIALRIRSYVLLGTGFLVTTVIANIVRYGIREPRAGAIFLSALGLLVVGFMVLLTTKREELLARYRSVQQLLARWEA